ncbi:MAG: hypothetical protein MI923_22995 [Phycisphaerales bacterium]|nr:hypothetical protein [Phycisphaerales bacterium]
MVGTGRVIPFLIVIVCAVPAFAGSVALQPRMGEPLDGLTAGELARFVDGKAAFQNVFSPETGLGPVYNKESCANCHNRPVGGSGSQVVIRFGLLDEKGGGFNPLDSMGGSLLQSLTIDEDMCKETVPAMANLQVFRLTPSVLGGGLIEAIDDADISVNADPTDTNGDGVSGRVHMVQPLEGGPLRVGRFGWKAQVATLLTFSADAGLNEIGITNDLVPMENAPNGNMLTLSMCDDVEDPEDTGPIGTRFIDKTTDFQRFLAAPPQTPKSGMTGEGLFTSIGCTDCHTASYTTNVVAEAALSNKVIKPYSDFLLHDMGELDLFDGIVQGDAQGTEIRTPALWGLSIRDPLLHNGFSSGGTFAARVTNAILTHGQVGSEAKPSVDQFILLSAQDQNAIIAFLESLGRAEFDHDNDNDRDALDQIEFVNCYSGDGNFYTPDDSCSISDVDQDSDVDCDDWQGFEAAFLSDNGVRPVLDIADFVGVLLGTITDDAKRCIADMNKDTLNDGDDIFDYVDAALGN